MKKLLLLFLFLGLSIHATTYKVGSSRTYKSPNALYNAIVLQHGDIIEIDSETYAGQAALAVWQKNNLIIKGVGGRPHLVANGLNIWGKGIWVLAGNNITVENIEFSGATVPDKNGAGIRLDGDGMTVTNCYFHDNENGILTANSGAGDVIIEHTEFANNGFGDGQSHNLYIGRVNSLTFRYNYSHHAKIGHNLKSRANENYILYNRIMDEETGFSSRLIDLPNGGLSLIMGNILMQGSNAENNNLIGYGLEGLSNPVSHDLLVINNTMVNKRVASCIFISIRNGTNSSAIHNNIFTGTGTVLSGTATTMSHNFVEENINNVLFMDEANYDYRIESGSPVVNAGLALNPFLGKSLIPDQHYVHPTNVTTRTNNGIIDIGAYESGATLSLSSDNFTEFRVYPNPTSRYLSIKTKAIVKKIIIYNTLGQGVLTKNETKQIDVSNLENGMYFLKISGEKRLNSAVTFIKK